jgi:hypothetical protein
MILDVTSLNSQALQPMRLANAAAGRSAPLHGPNGPGFLAAPAPRTREELMGFTSKCNLIHIYI